jgi:membrane-associated protein
MINLVDFVLNLDKYFGKIIANFGSLTYLVLFLIIFCETGLVFVPFLPGDSLLFLAGTFAATGVLNIFLLFIILSLGAILGDSLNYSIGKYLGERLFLNKGLIKREYLERTRRFYELYGGKTIIFSRFIPVIRTFTPFVAGIGKMNYFKFLVYNIIGGLVWVAIFLSLGYFFGTIPLVQNNFSLFILLIIFLSLLPAIIEIIRHKLSSKKNF